MKNAFDSVSRPLIILWWQRLGVPRAVAGWLVALDFHDHAICHRSYGLCIRDSESGGSILAFTPERGTSQADIHSSFTWLAVFDVLLTLLDNEPDSPDHLYLRTPNDTTHRERCLLRGQSSFCGSST